MQNIAPYAPAIMAIVAFILITLVQGALVGAKKASASMTPGGTPDNDYDSALYRMNRAHQNAIENMATIVAALVLAILVGVSAWWVNVLLGAFLVLRVIYLLIYLQNVGKATQGLRTFIYVASWAINVALCVMAVWVLL